MTLIDITDDGFTINGTSSRVVTASLLNAGLSHTAIAEVVGGWFIGVTGSTTPTPFQFTTDVESADPSGVVDYARSFAHTPWIDGESRVQAGLTPEELGFNARFQALENEFDAIADQFRRLGAAVANLRGDLFGVTDELELKLTTMQNEIHGLQQEAEPTTGPTILGTATVDGRESFVTQFGNEFKFVEFAQQPIEIVRDPLGGPHVFDPSGVQPGELFQLVPEIEEAVRNPLFDPLFAQGGATVAEMRRTGADVILPSGVTLGAVLADLPADMRFTDQAAAVDAIVGSVVSSLPTERATELRRGVLADDAVDLTGAALLGADVGSVVRDAAVADALTRAGFGTVESLAGASSTEVSAALISVGTPLDAMVVRTAVARAVIGRAVSDIGGG
jgi:hypothetical protein